MAFYSPEKPDVIFDEDGDVLLTVGDQSEKRNFLIRSSLLRQHSSYFDDVLKVQSHDSKNPWRRSYKRADVLALFIILRGLHSNIWPKQVGLRLLVRLVGATWRFNFDRELPDGSAPLRTAAWGWLFSIRERLGLSDMVRRWTLMKAAYFFGNLAAFNRLSLELVRGHIGLFANLENAQAAILGLGVDFPTPMKVTPDSLILGKSDLP
ncbi:hypothetical protein B0H65DRAFT_433103 [Neurospora tetraspora]|uniref:BTB domain-containing protein n=1 Tax=Neurospora tetraspora TaxID=94610 RepID=A0AAE0MN65_9PEZI|nr:hypothetical protein B0H65DRAFT_433103 [Neurospora tetraspora]